MTCRLQYNLFEIDLMPAFFAVLIIFEYQKSGHIKFLKYHNWIMSICVWLSKLFKYWMATAVIAFRSSKTNIFIWIKTENFKPGLDRLAQSMLRNSQVFTQIDLNGRNSASQVVPESKLSKQRRQCRYKRVSQRILSSPMIAHSRFHTQIRHQCPHVTVLVSP